MKAKKFSVMLAILAVILVSCKFAGAAEFTSYFKIAKDYANNESEARSKWINKDICVEGNILVSGPNGEGNQVIGLAAESLTLPFKYVVYGFIFSGIPEEATGLSQGQKVRIIGKVTEIEKNLGDQENVLTITAISSRLIQAQANEFTHFFRIPEDADKDLAYTKNTWLGKRVSIEGEVLNVYFDDELKFMTVTLYSRTKILSSIDEVGYMFFFRGINEEAAGLKEGQKVRISGKIIDIVKNDRVFIASLDSSLMLF